MTVKKRVETLRNGAPLSLDEATQSSRPLLRRMRLSQPLHPHVRHFTAIIAVSKQIEEDKSRRTERTPYVAGSRFILKDLKSAHIELRRKQEIDLAHVSSVC